MSCGSMILPTKNELMRGFPIIFHYYSIVIPLLFHYYSMTIPLLFHYYYSLIIPLLFPENSLIVPFKFHSSSTMIPLNSQKLGENPPFFSPPQLHRWAARPALAVPSGAPSRWRNAQRPLPEDLRKWDSPAVVFCEGHSTTHGPGWHVMLCYWETEC